MALRLMYRQHERYEAILQQAIQESNSSLQGHKQLGSLSQSDSLRNIAQVHGKPSGGKKELLYKQIDPRVSEHEEIVVTVQGFVLRCSLPPITRVDQLPKNPMAAKQSVTLTGLGSTEFEAAARAVLAIHTMFSSTLPDDALVPWKPQKDTDYVCLEFYNRYFKGRDETGSPAADIGTEIDPLGILRTRCPLGEHTEDNVVLYFERNTANITGTRTYTPCNPVGVRVGQLVEVQASFCVVPIAKGRYVMLCKLRAVCVLGTQVQDDLNEEIFNSIKSTPLSPTKKTKRSVGYVNRDDSTSADITTLGIKRLRLDDSVID